MIKAAIKCQNNIVMVFDKEGEQIPRYQGLYDEVKEKILEEAPLSAVFCYLPDYKTELEVIPREEW